MMDKNRTNHHDVDSLSPLARRTSEGSRGSDDCLTPPTGNPTVNDVHAREYRLGASSDGASSDGASSHRGQNDLANSADFSQSARLESDLAWEAMRFVWGELSDEERACFEQQMDDSQTARDALVAASLLVDCLQAATLAPCRSGKAIVPRERSSGEQASELGERQANSGLLATAVETTSTKAGAEVRQALGLGDRRTSRECIANEFSQSSGAASCTGTGPAAETQPGPCRSVRSAKHQNAGVRQETSRRSRWFRAVSLVTVLMSLTGALGVLISGVAWFANWDANLMQRLQPHRLGDRGHELAESRDTVPGATKDASELAYYWMETQQSWAGSDASSDLLSPAAGGEEDWSEATDHTMEDSVESIEAPSWMLAALQHRTTQGGEE